jgi:hypothetical protein
MIRVYVAGAITPTGKGNHAIEYLENVKQGIRASIRLMQYGFAPYCPMIDFQFFLCLYPNEEISAKMIYTVSVAHMLGCDAILRLPNIRNSVGWKVERGIATHNRIPIFTSIGALRAAGDLGEIKCRSLSTRLGT